MNTLPPVKILRRLPWLLLCGLFAAPAAADERYIFDKDHTAISFSVSRLGLFQVDGDFTSYDGSFIFCLQHPDKDAADITLYTAGIHTTDGDMDDELRGPRFFNAAQFPHMRFVSTAVTLTDNNHAIIMGNLTLLGVTKPVTLLATFTEKDHDAANGDYVVSFSASATIRRSDFGMNTLIPLIGNEVHLHIRVKGVESPGAS